MWEDTNFVPPKPYLRMAAIVSITHSLLGADVLIWKYGLDCISNMATNAHLLLPGGNSAMRRVESDECTSAKVRCQVAQEREDVLLRGAFVEDDPFATKQKFEGGIRGRGLPPIDSSVSPRRADSGSDIDIPAIGVVACTRPVWRGSEELAIMTGADLAGQIGDTDFCATRNHQMSIITFQMKRR